jgi:hypothetical protein
VTEFVDGARREIEERLALLRDEVKRLEAAAAALGDGRAPRRRGRPRGSAGEKARPPGAGRRPGSGKRAAQAERLVTRHPGITIPELAKRMKLPQATYLYKVMPDLEAAGKVKRRGREWHPA